MNNENNIKFQKPGESQKDAIKRYMRARKTAHRKADKRVFPAPGLTMHAYAHQYYALNRLLPMSGAAGVDELFGPLSMSAPVDPIDTIEEVLE